MRTHLCTLTTRNEAETARLARNLGALLDPGDVLLLEGEVGAGKTYFARQLIQSMQTAPEDVPSPTFTLMQTYDTSRGEVLHADLYRLSDPDELVELGLLEAFESAICLIEWPDRLGPDAPASALLMTFEHGTDEEQRTIRIEGAASVWGARVKEAIQ